MAGYRVDYKGAAIFVGHEDGTEHKIFRATAFGSTGTITREDIFEIGNSGLVDTVEDVSEVSMTIDANEYGSARTLYLLSGRKWPTTYPQEGIEIDLAKDFETSKVHIFNYMKPTGDTSSNYILEEVRNCVLTGYSANYTLDGNSTESFSLVSDNKRWRTVSKPSGFDDKEAGGVAGAKRRAHVEVSLFPKDSVTDGLWYAGQRLDEIPISVQSVSVDVTLDRENIGELGSLHYIHKPLVQPINVSVSFDVIVKDLKVLSELAGVDEADDIELDALSDRVGLLIKIYDNAHPPRTIVKELHIPYLIPTDEAFNISLDGNATRTFSFRSHQLGVYQGSKRTEPPSP